MGAAGDGRGGRDAHRTTYPRGHGRRPTVVHGAALPEPLRRRNELPRPLRIPTRPLAPEEHGDDHPFMSHHHQIDRTRDENNTVYRRAHRPGRQDARVCRLQYADRV